VEGGEFLGEFVRYDVKVGTALVVADRPHLRGLAPIERGTRVRLSVAPHEISVISP